jgi:hypothetical protein
LTQYGLTGGYAPSQTTGKTLLGLLVGINMSRRRQCAFPLLGLAAELMQLLSSHCPEEGERAMAKLVRMVML